MTKFKLALISAISLASLSSFVQPAAAIEYPWCARYGGDDGGGGDNCGFVSYEQCMMTIRGMGGSCEVNLFYADQQSKKPQRAKRKRPE